MLKSTLLFVLLFLHEHITAHGASIPDCSKPEYKETPECKCRFPTNWNDEICQGANWFEKPEIAQNIVRLSSGRIVGGENAPVDKYPWFARLISRSGGWAGCGGMLVAPEYVLTAAHCVFPSTSWSASQAAVQIGAVCPNSSNNCGQPIQQINVQSITPHPNYSSNTLNNDYALVKLVSRANATPVAMDQGQFVDSYPADKRNLYAIGLGTLSSGGNVASQLRHVELAFTPRSVCNSNYGGGITDSMMCAADPGQDSCQGDSGGPLYDDENNVLVGVVSWGYGCAQPQYPGVYAQVSSKWSWIKSGICDNHSTPKPIFCSDTPTPPTPTPPTPPTPTPPTPTPPTGCSPGELTVDISVTTDGYPGELAWTVGEYSSMPFSASYQTYDQQLCLDESVCHEFKITDTYGDGITVGEGDFSLKVNGETKLSLGNGFTTEMSAQFGDCDNSDSPCGDSRNKRFKINLKTDNYGYETSFAVKKKRNGQFKRVVFSGDDFDDNSEYNLSKCIRKKNCYRLEVYDSAQDGLCCQYGQGSFQGSWDGQVVPNEDTVFDDAEARSLPFGNC